MTRIAMQEVDEHGRGAAWAEQVTDQEYNAAPQDAVVTTVLEPRHPSGRFLNTDPPDRSKHE